jgi:hypothetical protein
MVKMIGLIQGPIFACSLHGDFWLQTSNLVINVVIYMPHFGIMYIHVVVKWTFWISEVLILYITLKCDVYD